MVASSTRSPLGRVVRLCATGPDSLLRAPPNGVPPPSPMPGGSGRARSRSSVATSAESGPWGPKVATRSQA
ncbi:hypothetical protein D3C72_796630 [compost metagenome]